MKKLFAVLLLVFGVTAIAEADVLKYRTTNFSIKVKDAYGYWGDWTDWQKCSVLVVLDSETERVRIYSEEVQEFDIIKTVSGWKSDLEGGEILEVACVDKFGSRCNMRFRQQHDGQWQLYVDYADAMYVYNINLVQ